MKKDYLLSEIMTIKRYLDSKWIKKNWHIGDMTTGWADEKLLLIEETKEEARKELKKNLVKIFTPSEKEISQTYEAVFTTLRLKAISNYQKIKRMPDWTIIIPPDVNVNEQKVIWEIIKAEKWEPTKFTNKWDFIPENDDELDDITFFLPDNGRDDLKQLN